jgi:hypothetical protein
MGVSSWMDVQKEHQPTGTEYEAMDSAIQPWEEQNRNEDVMEYSRISGRMQWGSKWDIMGIYPLVNIQKAIENDHLYSGFSQL